MKKWIAIACVMMLGLGLLAGCGDRDSDLVRIYVGATPRPHHEILDYITPMLRDAGIDLRVVPFTDFNMPNIALTDGQIHANYFQHVPFLNAYIGNTGNQLHVVGEIHVEPMGAYSLDLDNVMDIPDGGLVAIPGDATNGGRALMLLAEAGLIGLPDTINPAAGVLATVADISYNPRNLRFTELAAEFLPQVLMNREADLSVINTNHLIAGTNLCPVEDSLIRESLVGNPYANVLVVRPEYANNPYIQTIFEYLTSEAVRAFIHRTYTGIEPVF
ncbi:MAG: MetQ/NlpA family ABC transporter substrate-binding protein [Defluviitaleaceae bacterium]|nr:MetQ/NlpA family ABC transporter substrate-binding protein [Defluviitaleaceae bacterium]